MKNRRRALVSALAGVAMTTLLLTGCAGGQSKIDACKSIAQSVSTASSEVSSSMSNFQSDPDGAAKSMKNMAASFTTAAGKVTQSDIKPLADKAAAAMNDFSGDFAKLAADPKSPDTAAVEKSSQKMSDTFTALQKACTL